MELIVISTNQLEGIISRAIASALEAMAATATTTVKAGENLLTVTETAKRLRKSEKTVREYIKAKVLPAINANKGTPLRPSYSILEADVNAYIKRLKS